MDEKKIPQHVAIILDGMADGLKKGFYQEIWDMHKVQKW